MWAGFSVVFLLAVMLGRVHFLELDAGMHDEDEDGQVYSYAAARGSTLFSAGCGTHD